MFNPPIQAEKPLWSPDRQDIEKTALYAFIQSVARKKNIVFENYAEFYDWSIQAPELFWECFAEYSGILLDKPPIDILQKHTDFKKNRWFVGARFNFAAHLLKKGRDNDTAIIFRGEQGQRRTIHFLALRQAVSQLAWFFKNQGIQTGDRIVGVLPNIPEAMIAMLGTTAIGAIWSACSPDFGVSALLDRFSQISPRVLLISDGYFYKNQIFDLSQKREELIQGLPSVECVIVVPFVSAVPEIQPFHRIHPQAFKWEAVVNTQGAQAIAEIPFVSMDFNDPVYILFSSGTTGKPKCIVHGGGGIALEHLKEHCLHTDLKAGDILFYFTTVSWMMWHWQISALALGVTLLIYDGSPHWPKIDHLIDLIDEEGITVFGTSAKYIATLQQSGLCPIQTHALKALRAILSTGSVLLPEYFDWVYTAWKKKVMLCSISGGTDIVGCFALGNPLLPVYRGQLQCRSLGLSVAFYDDQGRCLEAPNYGRGELVCRAPFPSMPVGFWNDETGERFEAAYFRRFVGVWAQGDYGELCSSGGVVLYGRSDAVLNPGGVRIGTAEIYRALQRIVEIQDAVVVGQRWAQDERIILFVVLKAGLALDESWVSKIKKWIRDQSTPRHVPAVILQVPDVPRTANGKLAEVSVRQVIHHEPVANKSALVDPAVLTYFENRVELG
jgi:acetoacetyl-CoA synthetase